MLKEAKVIIPDVGSGCAAIVNFESHIIDLFGGFTLTLGSGAWKNDDGEVIRESVRVYTIAAVSHVMRHGHTWWHLRHAAVTLGNSLKQECVYVKHTDGEVEMLEPREWKLAKKVEAGLKTQKRLENV